MLKKLMKYEFKATGRLMLPLYGALIGLALINKIFIGLDVYKRQFLWYSWYQPLFYFR